MTNDEIRDEIRKCAEDPIYFIKKYIYIIHPIKGRIPFNLFRFQERLLREVMANRFSITRKFRQAGITTICAAYSVWYAIFKKNKNIVVVSIGERESKDFLDRAKEMYYDLPAWLRPKAITENAHTLKLSTGSVIKSQPAGAGRGQPVSILIVDEAAFIDNMEEYWKAVYPTVSTGGEVVMISTVNGMGNLYYDIYRKAELKQNEFHIIRIHWQEHPDYNEQWAKVTRANLGEKGWLQEVEGEFLGTGDTFIETDTLREIRDHTSSDYYEKYYRMMRVWKDPEPYAQYLITADASYGRGRDHSAFHVINLYTGEQVAEFYSNTVSLPDFAKYIAQEGMNYNMAAVAPERNVLGTELIRCLFEDHEYDNMWMDQKGDFGFLVNAKNKETLLTYLQDKLANSKLKINSKRTFDELSTFIISNSGKLEAEKGHHDDLVLSLALAAFIMEEIQDSIPDLQVLDKKQEWTIMGPTAANPQRDLMKDYLKWI